MTSAVSVIEQMCDDAEVRRILGRALDGEDVTVDDAVALSEVTGGALRALSWTADELRRRQCGDDVSYVVNRNINFTNVCIKACRFCAFSRKIRAEEGYLLPIEAIVQRAVQAVEMGATEVCLQAGLAPDTDASFYVAMIRAIKAAAPQLHIHALSPEEIKHGARQSGLSFEAFLTELKDAGLGSLPGTSAEILDDALREAISPGRITTAEWIEVIQAAHGLGIPTTSTMMFGHVETAKHRAEHMALLRHLQRETGGFTEFVPLSFVHDEAPMFVKAKVPGVRPGPTGNDVVRLYATARLMLGADIPHLQVSWVKEGLRLGQRLLDAGCDDLGGTLMNESISTQAGASNGQLVPPAMLRKVIRDAGRVPVQRNTAYGVIARFGRAARAGEEDGERLNSVLDAAAIFGSYEQLAADGEVRYQRG